MFVEFLCEANRYRVRSRARMFGAPDNKSINRTLDLQSSQDYPLIRRLDDCSRAGYLKRWAFSMGLPSRRSGRR